MERREQWVDDNQLALSRDEIVRLEREGRGVVLELGPWAALKYLSALETLVENSRVQQDFVDEIALLGELHLELVSAINHSEPLAQLVRRILLGEEKGPKVDIT